MNENNFKLNYSTPHSAQMVAILEEQEKEFNKIKKMRNLIIQLIEV